MGDFSLTIEACGVDISITLEDGYNPTIVDDLMRRMPVMLAVSYRSIVEQQRELGVESEAAVECEEEDG